MKPTLCLALVVAAVSVAAHPAEATPLFKATLVFDIGQDLPGTVEAYGDQRTAAAGDLNGDGRADVVVPNRNSAAGAGTGNTISVLLSHTGLASPSLFAPKVNYTVGPGPRPIALADFDNDRNLDVVTYNGGDGTVTVLLGNGLGQFGARMDTDVDMLTATIAVGDVDEDGNLDIVLGVLGEAARAFLGNGAGGFSPAALSAANTGSGLLADVNQDGHLDLVGISSAPSGIRACIGNVDGTFQAPIFSATALEISAFALADYDFDTVPDFIAAGKESGSPRVDVILGAGNGTFSTIGQSLPLAYGDPFGMQVGDVDLDGSVDIVVTINLAATAVVGEGVNTIALIAGSLSYYDGGGSLGNPVLGDFDGDGALDIAAPNFAGTGPGTSGAHALSVILLAVEPGYHVPVTHDPVQETIADVNRDGKPDMIVSAGEARFDVHLGNGAGGFFPPIAVPTTPANAPGPFAVGDVNRDGILDLVPSSANMLLGVGDGTFTLGAAAPSTGLIKDECLFDLNRDGILDLARLSGTTLVILPGLPDGTFGSGAGYGLTSSARSITVADWNRDGIPDLALALVVGIKVWFGNPDGSLTPTATIEPSRGFHDVTSGDFNRDGKLDLAARDEWSSSFPSDYGGISVFFGTGGFGFSARTAYTTFDRNGYEIASWDVNRDGAPDLVASSHEFLDNGAGDSRFWTAGAWLGDGAGGFARDSDYLTGVGQAPHQMGTGDVDRDGQPDILGHSKDYANDATTDSYHVTILRGNLPAFPQGLAYYSDAYTHLESRFVRAGDFNRDGSLDLLSFGGPELSWANEYTLRLGLGNGFFGASVTGTLPLITIDVDTADLNRDGILDLVAAGYPLSSGQSSVTIGLGNGAGFGPQIQVAAATPFTAVATGDVNRDGRPDIVCHSSFLNEVYSFLGNGDGTFQPAIVSGQATVAWDIALGDLNRDGVLDLVTATDNGGTTFSLGDGAGNFAVGVSDGSERAQYLALADMNRDGWLDVVTDQYTNLNVGAIAIKLNNGNGGFSQTIYTTGGRIQSVAVGDLNGDGSHDVLAGTPTGFAYWYGNGFGGLGAINVIATPTAAPSLALGDWNRDALPDVAVAMGKPMLSLYKTGPGMPTSVEVPAAAPAVTRLEQNYPNPFNPHTKIGFTLGRPGRARLEIFDVSGRRVATLVHGNLPAGLHQVAWSGRNAAGRDVTSGIYFYRLETEDLRKTRRMVLVR